MYCTSDTECLSRTSACQPFHFLLLLPHNIPLPSLVALFCSVFSQKQSSGMEAVQVAMRQGCEATSPSW